MSQLIVGCGYLGHGVATYGRHRGDAVDAGTRVRGRADLLAAVGLTPLIANLHVLATLALIAQLRAIDMVLFAVGFDRSGGQTIREVYVDGLANVLSVLPGDAQRFIYISSTGVYG